MKKGSKKRVPKYVILVNHWCTFYYQPIPGVGDTRQELFDAGTMFEINAVVKREGQRIVCLSRSAFADDFTEYEVNARFFKESFRLLPEVGEI